MTTTKDVYLITGAQGFLGAWIIKLLLERFATTIQIIALDLKEDDTLYKEILTEQEVATLERVYADVGNTTLLCEVFRKYQPTHVIHLAGLQIPTCRTNPALGATVNVLGTVNVFEAAKQIKPRVKNIIYASSAAACGPEEDYLSTEDIQRRKEQNCSPLEVRAVLEDDLHKPRTHYGIFKLANEGNARIFWQDSEIPSVGLRPLTIFGVGREIGMTSAPSKAIKACILQPEGSFSIPFKGYTSFQDVVDIANLFILCSRKCERGALVCGIKGHVCTVEEFLKTAERVVPKLQGFYSFTADAVELPFPSHFSEKNLENLLGEPVPLSSLETSIQRMAKIYSDLYRK